MDKTVKTTQAEINKILGEDLRKIRTTHKISQIKFSMDLNISEDALSKYERGINRLPDEIIVIIYNLYGKNLYERLLPLSYNNSFFLSHLKKEIDEEISKSR